MTQEEALNRLNIIVDLVPPGSSNRPGIRIQPTHITIHNTSNASRGADALLHARYIKGPDARRRKVSWHFTVDDLRCVKHLPTTEKAWHAGRGNGKSIGIEVCEHQGINKKAAIERAELLTATLMLALNIPRNRVVTHQFWTGKDCPHVILREAGGFEKFQERASLILAELQEATSAAQPRVVEGSDVAPEMKSVELNRAGGFAEVIDQLILPPAIGLVAESVVEMAPFAAPEEDRIAGLERLVGRLTYENEALRRAVRELQDNSLEAD